MCATDARLVCNGALPLTELAYGYDLKPSGKAFVPLLEALGDSGTTRCVLRPGQGSSKTYPYHYHQPQDDELRRHPAGGVAVSVKIISFLSLQSTVIRKNILQEHLYYGIAINR